MTRKPYVLHPAYGLRRVSEEPKDEVDLARMPLSWLRLSRSEREVRERQYFTEVLQWLSAAEETPEFDAFVGADQRVRLADQPAVQRDHVTMTGPLTPDSATLLAEERPHRLRITSSGTDVLGMRRNWRWVVIWLTDEQSRRLEQHLDRVCPWREGVGLDGRGTSRALAYRASQYLIPVGLIAPGIAIGAISSDTWTRYVIAFAVLIVLLPLALWLRNHVERRY
jgi:hypothetical protein